MIKKKVKFEEEEHTPILAINHDHITSNAFKEKARKKKESKVDLVILEDMKYDDLDQLTEMLWADDDVNIVKEFLHGAKASLSLDTENIRRMLMKI